MVIEIFSGLGFLFWFFLFGLVVACVQDLKRTEVDNWLNFLLFTGGSAFLVLGAIFSRNYWVLIYGLFSLVCLIVFSEIVYRARIFAGGDYKLLIAMFAVFAGLGFGDTAVKMLIFLLVLLFSGSLWGIGFSAFIYMKNYSKINREIRRFFGMKAVRIGLAIGVLLSVFSYFHICFLCFSIFIVFSILLFVFVKSIENKMMIRFVKTGELREGDWLVGDISAGKRTIKSREEGLTKREIGFLRRFKNKRVKIKQGIPFVPAFLIAFLLFSLSYDWIFAFFRGIFGF